MNSRFHNLRLAGTLALLLPVLSSCASKFVLTPAQVGHWEGNARIIMTWCQQTNLPVKLDIQADGSVVGTVGDAKLKEGRFLKNRGWLGRKLNIETDYIITGNLDGAIVAAEGIIRARVMMPFNFDGGLIKGGVATSGSWFGGKAGMVLTAQSLKLTHSQ
jgi:hypothetical protein